MAAIDYRAIARGFPTFNSREVNDFITQFQQFDSDGNGSIDRRELSVVMGQLGEQVTDTELDNLIAEVDLDNDNTIDFREFLTMMANIKSGAADGTTGMARVVTEAGRVKMGGHSDTTEHSFSEEERAAFVDHMNYALQDDADIEHYLPMDPDNMDMFEMVKDGLILAKLINDSVADTIDERALNKGHNLNRFKQVENGNLVVNSAKAIGCNVVNVGADDIMAGTPHLILGLIWQIIRIGLLNQINLMNHPELYRLLEEGEELEDFLKLPPDQILLRWFNYHLANAGTDRRVHNFGGDIKDSECYTILLNQLKPNECGTEALGLTNPMDRAEAVLVNADKLGCRRFVRPRDIVAGNKKLNFAFVANLFNTCPGLAPLTEEEMSALEAWLFDSEGDREARAFCLWINCLGIDPFVSNLFEDLRDGLVLLKVMDKVSPGIVHWRNVNTKTPIMKFKAIENCNYAVVLGKSMKFSLVGVQGADIHDGSKTLTLALVWQLMRAHILSVLARLGDEVTEDDMIAWANEKAGGSNTMSSFRDPSIRTGHVFIDILNNMGGNIDQELITDGGSDEDAMLNAKYAISVARKIGALIFLLPEDIVEVKPKMILTLVGTLMALDRGVL